MLTEDDIREALRACYAPGLRFERPLNIVDLGLIESIALRLDHEAPGAGIPGVPARQALTLILIATSAEEDARIQLHAQIANRLAGLEQISRTTILFAASPAWTAERISPEGRRILRLDPPTFPILNNRVR
jgi:metal-sulfur cluster biosynthetic enzyme